MFIPQPPPEVAYPPAPWHTMGQVWVGLFLADQPVPLPAGLRRVLPSRCLIVALLRHRAGTLGYDELMIGPLVRLRLRVGLWVESIWVDDLHSLWGGRRIWGMQKELATFDWHDDTVTIADHGGLVATIAVNRRPSHLPPLPLPAPGFGRKDNAWAFLMAHAWASLGRADMHIHDWSPRFPYRIKHQPLFALAANPARMTFPPPVLLRSQQR